MLSSWAKSPSVRFQEDDEQRAPSTGMLSTAAGQRGGSPVTGLVSSLGLRQAGKAGPLGDLV